MRILSIRGRRLAVIFAGILVLGFLATVMVLRVTDKRDSSAASFSDTSCSAAGATATRTFAPSGLNPNGINDNTRAVQNAINAASSAGGGVVPLPAGTFLIDGHLLVKSNVKLVGTGAQTVLKAGPVFLDSTGPDGGFPLITTSGASNVTIADLTADQSGNIMDANRFPARLAAYLIDVRDSRNAVVAGVYTRNPFTYSIAIVGSSDFCVTRSNTRVATSGLYYQLDGIHILDSNTGQVIDNYVDQRIGTDGDDGLVAHSTNRPVYDILYADNTVRGGSGGDGMQLAVGNHPIYNVVVRNNTFWGSPFGIRTGYWAKSGPSSTVRDIVISDNVIHNLVPGKAFPNGGDAVDIFSSAPIANVTQITVTGNHVCNAGKIIVVRGTHNVVNDNYFCRPGGAAG